MRLENLGNRMISKTVHRTLCIQGVLVRLYLYPIVHQTETITVGPELGEISKSTSAPIVIEENQQTSQALSGMEIAALAGAAR